MIDDFIEGFVKVFGSFLFKLFVEIIGFYTGEIVLFFLSFGKKKPRWDYYAEDSPSRFVIFTEISVWLGLFFWVVVVGLIAWFI